MAAKVPSTFQRWVKPDVYPLIAAMGTALSMMTYTGVRTLFWAPDVFVNKGQRVSNEGEMCDNRTGEKFKHSPLRQYVRTQYDVESEVSPHVPARK